VFLATSNKPKQLLYLSFIHQVQAEELEQARENVTMLLADLDSGFRLLTDLGRLDSMDLNCAAEIGRMMELCDQKGASLIVRVIPDHAKDIGLNILSLFHYRHAPRTVTCNNMAEAAKILALSPAS
jgi:anti-anti-sigma regulatory factor